MQKSAPKPKYIKKVAGIDPTTRADYGKGHVIISEKRDKKAAKYLVKDLPYPYTSKAQFERTMEMPLGTEWNTRVGFQRGTLPRVVKKVCFFLIKKFFFCAWVTDWFLGAAWNDNRSVGQVDLRLCLVLVRFFFPIPLSEPHIYGKG